MADRRSRGYHVGRLNQMESDRWSLIERICHAAMARNGSDRTAFLDEACGGDESLRHEVDAVLAVEQSAQSLLAELDIPDAANADFNGADAPGERTGDFPGVEQAAAAGIAHDGHRRSPADRAVLPAWAHIVVAGAISVTAGALITHFSAWNAPTLKPHIPPLWVYAALSSMFIVLGMALAFGNKSDARAAWLGGIFSLVAAPLAAPLISARGYAPLDWLLFIRPDAFGGAFLWRFLADFPSDLSPRAGRTVRRIAAVSAWVAAWCVAANVAAFWLPPADTPQWVAPFLIRTTHPARSYWLVVFGMVMPALPVLLVRGLMATGDARRRVRLFVWGLVAGLAPFAAEVLAEETSPAYKAWAHGPVVEPWVGTGIFGALAILPFITAYSVLFDRVVEVRVALRAALQYVLARYTIIVATLVPFAALASFMYEHRSEPIGSLAVGARPLLLGGVGVFGLVALRLRSRWLVAVDRRYFREPYDAGEIVTRLVGELKASSAGELADTLRNELERAFHAAAELFVADDLRTALHHVGNGLSPLGLTSTLVGLAAADSRPMDVDQQNEASPLSRLPPNERLWLQHGRFSLLIALRRASGAVEGLLALSSKRSGLRYSPHDRRLLSAVASAAGLALDRIRSRGTPESPPEPPARECVKCARLSAFDTTRCECGGDVVVAAVPFVLRGIFRLQQRIGAGGMGVVYRAVDLNLGRQVAIKALPRITPDLGMRLRREARAMAAVTHEHLAVIHGVETWQGMPFLVQEFLAGGTLTERLAASKPSIDDVLDLGETLAETLDHLHRHGVVHCDIKPGNIGFTDRGVVKLLDFGLARIVREARSAPATEATTMDERDPSALVLDPTHGWFGTPHFMSPEAACGQRPAPSFDLWALAVVMYDAIAGRRPFNGPSALAILAQIVSGPTPDIREARPDVSPGLAAFFARALARDASRRPPDGLAFAADIRALRTSNR